MKTFITLFSIWLASQGVGAVDNKVSQEQTLSRTKEGF